MGYKQIIHEIGTHSCYGWPWDINRSCLCPFHHTLFVGHDPKLLVSIYWDVMVIFNLHDPNV